MAPIVSTPSQIAGYHILSLSLPTLRSLPAAATHYIYIGPHQPKVPTSTAERSLFLINVPIDATASHIRHLFSQQIGLQAGRIESIDFEGNRAGGESLEKAAKHDQPYGKKGKKRIRANEEVISIGDIKGTGLPHTWDRDLRTEGLTAIVLFVDKSSADTALKAVKKTQKNKKQPVWGEGVEEKVPALGSARYTRHHQLSYPDKASILESVNKYMTAFAAKEASHATAQKRQRTEVDADGFITVTRGGRTNPAKQEAAKEQAEKQREKQKGLEDFYRFQSREKRKERATELVRKFEEDREKVRKMKERRGRFKPER